MQAQHLVRLILASFVALGITIAAIMTAPRYEADENIGRKIYPALLDKASSVNKLVITTHSETLTMIQGKNFWKLEEHHGYPVYGERVRNVILGMARMEIVEPKTVNPERYAALQVNNPADDGALSRRIELFDKNGKKHVDIIVGRKKLDLATVGEGVYIRKTGNRQSWLVKTPMDATGGSSLWLKQPIIDIDKAMMTKAVLTAPDGHVSTITRGIGKHVYKVEGLDDVGLSKVVKELDKLDLALKDLKFKDVLPQSDLPEFAQAEKYKATIKTRNGLIVNLAIGAINNGYWLDISLETERMAKDETIKLAKELNKQHKGWLYRITAQDARPFTLYFGKKQQKKDK